MGTKICNHCGIEKDEEEFSWRYEYLGIRNKSCKDCQSNFNKSYYQGDTYERHKQVIRERKAVARETARDYVYNYLLTHPCESCGETDPRVLEFHHVGEKDMAVTTMTGGGYSIERIKAELEKCQVLCANCHRRITVEERGWYRGKK
jgi:HNH endonuclease